MVKTWTVEDAREDFDAVLRASETEGPQIVSESGKAVAVLLPIEQWRRMEERPKPDHEAFKKLLMAPQSRAENLAAPHNMSTELESPQRPKYRNLKEWILAPEPRVDDFVAPRIRPTKLRPPPTFED